MRPAGSDDVASLLEAAGRGDSAAFAQFFDATQRLVRGIILRVVRDRALAEEVTQDVYLELWRHAPRFEKDRGSARSWTTTIAHRRAVDRVRSEQARRDRELRHEVVVDLTTDPADEFGDAAEQARVRDALDQLSSIQREAIKLAYYEGNTYQQVARLLDIPEGTAKTRIRDGLVKLRDALGVSP
jgi:RNA polymerase sigma-70 factor (ECF subfamily)